MIRFSALLLRTPALALGGVAPFADAQTADPEADVAKTWDKARAYVPGRISATVPGNTQRDKPRPVKSSPGLGERSDFALRRMLDPVAGLAP